MTSNRLMAGPVRNAVCTALAAALVAGCTSGLSLHSATGHASSAPLSDSKADREVAKIEAAVAKTPADAAARSALAQVYLQAGRFDSAATTFQDAIDLGAADPRNALGMALADIGAGRNRQAIVILDQWRDSIPASDLGLALALAGQTDRGVAVLAEALRGGDNSPKLRQNLAYAYALDGRWREARLMAAQDVPADQLDARISEWARSGRPEDYNVRVAGLLGAPVRSDPGQPVALALNVAPAAPRMAEAAPPAFTAPGGELPAVGDDAPEYVFPDFAAVPPVPELAEKPQAVAEAGPASFEAAFAETVLAAEPGFVSRPVVQQLPERSVQRDRVANTARLTRAAAPAKVSKASYAPARGKEECTHLVQLGSFSSEARARKAWDIFAAKNPELRKYEMTITPAIVRGKNYWRVAAAGFDRKEAAGLCSDVKRRGGGCIAYAADRPLPGALPSRGDNAPRMAAR
ncbi:SPOR domain-containing protein [Novosphingobium marinum]|uniref:Tetratricopeptide (TPR) repeat protein n=1 Tax=Novosphingobium marinum TaxID=1514948 RepID=A0A7Y9XXF0_9SPHN|nr:SPOR domain-containing protein [Novosphingobium marinum]NYH96369.1 tetratricopeptide (TPR) repeat protein [Novosphingobium marinum]